MQYCNKKIVFWKILVGGEHPVGPPLNPPLFSTIASVTTVLSTHPYISSILWVNLIAKINFNVQE